MDLEGIMSRRSVSPRWLVEPGPSEDQLRAMIRAACSAADHRRLQPFRFIHVDNARRDKLSDLFVLAAYETHGDMTAEQETRAREKAMNGAVLVALVACIQRDVADVPEHEQWIAVGAALQNALLAAHAQGFSAMIVSGDKVTTSVLRTGLGITPSEHLVGFIAVGTASKTPRPRAELDPVSKLSLWPNEEGLAA